MTFSDLIDNVQDMKEEAVKEKFKKALETVLECYDSIPAKDIAEALHFGEFESFLIWENDDIFGTEGMKL